MTNPKNGSTLASWQLISIGAGSVVILGLAGFGAWNLFSPKGNTSQSSPASQAQDSIQKKLIGQWQVEKVDGSSGNEASLIFAADNKFYAIQGGLAYEGTYLVTDTISTPQKIVITILGQGQDIVLNPVNEKQLTFLSDSSISAQKISDTGVLPEGVRLFTEQDRQAAIDRQDLLVRQTEGRNNAGAVNRAQQAYYLENSQFASSFTALGVGISEEGRSYRYTIDVVDRSQLVWFVATPKQEGMKSYIGIVKTVPVGTSSATMAIACESLQPTTATPPRPSNSGRNTGEPTCPEGYSKLGG